MSVSKESDEDGNSNTHCINVIIFGGITIIIIYLIPRTLNSDGKIWIRLRMEDKRILHISFLC